MIDGNRLVILAWNLLVTTAFATNATAQEENKVDKKFAATRWKDVDDDFHLMGEYQSLVRDGCGGAAMGLQVVARGNGKFIGVRYPGGLPGTGWNRSGREELSGQRSGDVVTLAGNITTVEVRRGSATLLNKNGRPSSHLTKVHRQSPTLGMAAPANAYTLFDGNDLQQFKGGALSEEGWLKEGTELKSKFRDYTLHLEFRLPYMPYASGQGRSNSGIYLQSSYEVQVLDSFGLEGVENECGALYRYRRPDVNMCLPPLSWQTYDLTFYAPRYDASGNKIQNARITVLHNGVAVHNNFEIERKTGAGKQETGELWPTKLQDHGNPVRFRNIWLIDLENASSGHFTGCWSAY